MAQTTPHEFRELTPDDRDIVVYDRLGRERSAMLVSIDDDGVGGGTANLVDYFGHGETLYWRSPVKKWVAKQ